MMGSSTYYTKEEKNLVNKFKIVLAQKNQICRKQLKSQDTTDKTSRNITNKAKQEIKKSCIVPQVIMHRGGVEVGPPEMPGVHNRAVSAERYL